MARTHHDRWDGRGNLTGLAGAEIPLGGRIVAVADVFDALTHERPYKAAWPVAEAVAEIERQSGRQFDPGVVETTLKYGKISVPGAFTPTEILRAFAAGGDVIKVFPATKLGPEYFKRLITRVRPSFLEPHRIL